MGFFVNVIPPFRATDFFKIQRIVKFFIQHVYVLQSIVQLFSLGGGQRGSFMRPLIKEFAEGGIRFRLLGLHQQAVLPLAVGQDGSKQQG
jgi:hypothetical protein